MPRKSIIITATYEVLEGDNVSEDAKILEAKVYEMLVDRDYLNQKNRNPEVRHIITTVPSVGPFGKD